METVAEIEPEDGQEFNQLRRVEYELIDDRYQTNLFIVWLSRFNIMQKLCFKGIINLIILKNYHWSPI